MSASAKDVVVREYTNGRGVGNLLSFADTAQKLKVSKAQLSKLINGKVPGLPRLKIARLGRRVLVREEALAQWVQEVEACNADH
ncbi:MAG TPA: helix-turn-helix domain-containing protein [Bryobacteraceae bacterium]|jgi:hypothetical protein|nr:helix-turn-helix domain-containing protein [Bryobacteraceae bacterium]